MDENETIDQQARDMANAAFFAWANLVGVIADTMKSAQIPQELIHDFLDRLADHNNRVLPEKYREGYSSAVRVIRDTSTDMQ